MPNGASVRQPSIPRARSAGFIIVAVLWIIGALATLAVIYSFYVRKTALSFVGHDEQLQAQAMAMSAVELAAYQLTKTRNTANGTMAADAATAASAVGTVGGATGPASLQPPQGRFFFRQGNAAIRARFASENARVDLNFAPKQLLAGLIGSFGAPNDEAQDDADRIIAWRSPVKAGQSDPNASFYQTAGTAYGPRHGPFQHPDELALVAGLRPALVDRILPYVTVYSGRPEVNALAAPPQVLAALPGMTPEHLKQFLVARQSDPQDVLKAQLGPAAQFLTFDATAANRVTVTVQFPTGTRIRSQAVILVAKGGTAPYRILSWQDDVPAPDRGFVGGVE